MFDNPKRVVDLWYGEDLINLHQGSINRVSYTFRVLSDEIEDSQRGSAIKILNEYEDHWAIIKPNLTSRLSLSNLGTRILMYVPALVGDTEYDYMLGYEFKVNESIYSAFFAFNDGHLEWKHVDEF